MRKTSTRRRIQEFLVEKQRSHAWLAEKLGISRSHLSMVVNSHRPPSLDVAVRLSAITGIPVADFLPARRRKAA